MTNVPTGFTLRFMVTTIVILAVILTVGVSTTIGYQHEKQALINTTLDLNRFNAEKVALTTDKLLQSFKVTVLNASGVYADNLHIEQQHKMLSLILDSNTNLNSVFVADQNGIVLDSVPVGKDNIIGKQLTSVGASQALALKQPLISQPYIAITNRLIVLVSCPIFDQKGNYLGFVGANVYLNQSNAIGTLLGGLPQSDNNSYIYVVSAGGTLIYHPDANRVGQNVMKNEVVENVLGGASGQQETVNVLGQHMLAGYYPIQETGWGVVAQSPRDAIILTAENNMRKVLVYSIPVILAVVALIYGLIFFISKPLYTLANFGSSDSVFNQKRIGMPRIHHWNYEANQLFKMMAMAIQKLQAEFQTLSIEANTDVLTGLNNRRTMEQYMNSWAENQVPFSYMIIDVDHFKLINDTYGHTAGDEALRFLAENLQFLTTMDDISCRYGGEEFVILSPNSNLNTAQMLAERIRRHIKDTVSPVGQPLTVSIGLSVYDGDETDITGIQRRADRALYQAKRAGRNCVFVA